MSTTRIIPCRRPHDLIRLRTYNNLNYLVIVSIPGWRQPLQENALEYPVFQTIYQDSPARELYRAIDTAVVQPGDDLETLLHREATRLERKLPSVLAHEVL